MYIGHIGVGLVARGVAARTGAQAAMPPLWLLLWATFGPDWWETLLILCRVSDSAMWSHSIPAVVMGSGIAYGVGVRACRSRTAGAWAAGLYMSHIFMDYITGKKPTWPGGPRIGMGVYDYPVLDFALESIVITAGILLYRQSLVAPARHRPVLWGLFALLIVLQAMVDAKMLR